MRKILATAVLAVVALGMAPSHASGSTSGTIALPVALAPRAQRCASSLNLGNGTVGHTLSVTPGASFTLVATDANAALQDLEISFYKNLTPCEAPAASVATETDHETVTGDEAGTVPPDATVAVITLYTGANASFTYTE